jgi:intracellular sulfur oxidation DsrE/DsrF family protein
MSYKNPFKSIFIPAGLLAAFMFGLGVSGAANAADENDGGNNECPVGILPPPTHVAGSDPATILDDEFGPGTQELTRCLERRHNVKVVIQINKFCRTAVDNADCTRPYALGNIRNMIKDYENTHGMKRGQDYEIVAVVHSGGGSLMLKEDVRGNQFEDTVAGLMADGVKFYFCQNTTRGMHVKTADLIPGVQYTTAGVTAIAEFQSLGYRYVQP